MPEEQFLIRPVGIIKNKVKEPFLKSEDSDLKLQKEIDISERTSKNPVIKFQK